jgi:predicted lactoylglutathione lyase
MAGGFNGYRAALVRRLRTLVLISSLPGTAGLPPFISFSTSCAKLDTAPRRSLARGSATRESKNMIDHVILTVSDFKRSVGFYAKALKPLGITNFTDYEGHEGHPDLKGFGDGKRAFFWLKEGKPDPQAVHVGFVAKDHAEVDAFYKAAVAAGGKSKEAPQARTEYYPGYYATWVLDPDGHDIEVVHKS